MTLSPLDTNTTIVITGAAGGMGQATAQTLTQRGYSVLGLDHDAHALQDLAARLGPAFTPLACDVRDAQLTAQVLSHLAGLAPLAGLVNMVGISRGGGLNELKDDDWQHAFEVNVTPAMRLTQALAPLMQASRQGSIVNVGSPVGVVGARKPQYAASKAALHGLTMSCARALGKDGVRVNLLLPGPTITCMTKDWSAVKREEVAQGSALKRLCKVEEVAVVIAFLLGPDSTYLTASVLDMTAGSMMSHG